MKQFKSLLLLILLFNSTIFAQTTIETCVTNEEKPNIAQKIDNSLGYFTQPFVGFIFYSFPLSTNTQTISVDLSNEQFLNNYSVCQKNDSLFISGFKVAKGKDVVDANEISLVDAKLGKVEGTTLVISAKDLPSKVEISAHGIFVSLPWVLIPLIFGALFFTFYFGFPNIRLLPYSIKTVRGDYEHIDADDHQPNVVEHDNPDTIRIEGKKEGEVTHFQALTAALSATVGLGNIAGVAVAVVIGGAGATFWMILAGLIGMSSKFVECTLGVKFRDVANDGKVYGGPMYYLSKGISGPFGKFLAILFAVLCIGGSFGGGNMFQANQAASIVNKTFSLTERINALFQLNLADEVINLFFGVIVALLVGVVIIGGIKRIAQVTEKIVPFMAVIYVGAALVIIVMNYHLVPAAISAIITKAFAPTAITGGLLGVLIQGFRRAAFSNEAGVGSAAIAHSAVKTKYPASEGLVALLEPFIDTVVICTMTALVIVIGNLEGLYQFGGISGNTFVAEKSIMMQGVDLTSFVFDKNIPYFSYVLTIAVVLFAFSTMISWSYYGLQSWTYLFGKGAKKEIVYKVLFCVFVVIGAAAKMGNVLDFSDAMIFGMMVPNMIGLLILFPVVKTELKKYMDKIKS